MRLTDRYALGFYALYAWNLRTWGKGDVPQMNVCLVAGFVLALGVMSVLFVVDSLAGTRWAELPWVAETTIILLFTIFARLHYVRLVKGRESQMREAVDSYAERKKYLYAAVLYVVLILVGAYLLGYLSTLLDERAF